MTGSRFGRPNTIHFDIMRPLWNVWRCRRNANFFMLSLAGFFGLLIIVAIIRHLDLDQYIVPALPALVLGLIAWSWRAIRQARARRGERLQRMPMSCDELRVARSKLMKRRTAKSL